MPKPTLQDLLAMRDALPRLPWRWFANNKSRQIHLATEGGGRKFIMGFARWGTQQATPRFYLDGAMQAPHEFMESDHNGDFAVEHPAANILASAPAAVTLAEEFAKALALTHAKLGDIYEVLAGHVENIDCEKPLDEDSPEFALASAWGLAGAASAHIAALLDRHLPNWRDHARD